MKFKEAQKVVDDNWDVINPKIVDSAPVHMVLKHIIAPNHSRLEVLATVFNKMTDDQLSNEDVLFDMGLMSDNLTVYVALMMKGYTYFLQLDAYKSSTLFLGTDGNSE